MKKDFLTCLILVIISCASHLLWISKTSVLTSGDWLYLNNSTLKQLFSLPNLWQSNSLGAPNFTSSFYPLDLMMGALSMFNLHFGLIERMVFMWPIVFLLPISSYILLRKIFKNNVAVFVGSLVYSYNTYFLVLQTGHLTLLTAFAIAPLVIYFFINSLEKQKVLYALITGLLLFVVSFYEFRVFYILSIVLFTYYIFNLFVEVQKNKLEYVKKTILLFIPIFIVLILNIYWLIGLFNIGALSTNPLFDRILFGNEFLNIFHALTLHHPFWTGGKSSIFILQKIPFYFWIIPLTAILGLLFNRKNKYILFFSLIALIGIFLTKQVAHPFTGVYPFLFENFPGFNAFREASKFFFLVVLGFSVLIAGFVNWLWESKENKKIIIFSRYFFPTLISLVFLVNLTPLITGSFQTLFVPRNLPQDYVKLNAYIDNQDEFFRTFWLPTRSRWATYSNMHPAVNAVDAINFDWNSQVKFYRNELITEGELMKHLVIEPSSEELFNQTSVKYVIVPLEDLANDDKFFEYYGRKKDYYVKVLDNVKYLKRLNIGTEDVVVYENINYKPKFYSTSTPETFKSKNAYKKINYDFINPSTYKITLTNISSPVFLNFSENFNPKWMIFSENFKWQDIILKKQNPLNIVKHERNQSGVNSFYINPDEICRKISCVRNSTGGYDMKLTLYFVPQSYMYLGILISLTAFIALIALIVILFIKSIYEKKNK